MELGKCRIHRQIQPAIGLPVMPMEVISSHLGSWRGTRTCISLSILAHGLLQITQIQTWRDISQPALPIFWAMPDHPPSLRLRGPWVLNSTPAISTVLLE